MPREYLCAFCLREDQRAEDLEDEKEASFEGLPLDLQKTLFAHGSVRITQPMGEGLDSMASGCFLVDHQRSRG